jgi:hypothetical protein
MPTADFTPSVEELGRFMKTRTRTRMGAVVGTFDDTTPVTAAEAAELIANAADEVAITVGPNLPDGPEGEEGMYRNGAKALTTVLAAMNVEAALAPETIDDPRSAYNAYERRYIAFKKSLIEAVAEVQGGESDEGDDSSATINTGGTDGAGNAIPLPLFNFPEPMTRLEDRF